MTDLPISPPSSPSSLKEKALRRLQCFAKPYGCVRAIWLKGFHKLPAPVQRFLAAHPIAVTITLIVLLLLSYGYYAITKEPEPEIITAEVVRGDLVQNVEAVGKVISERDLNLQFPTSGVVAEVLVKEGDHVTAGQRLASLRAGNLAAAVQSALASLQAAQAELQELQEGTRPEDIAVAEAELANKRAQLEAAQSTLTAAEGKLAVLEQEVEIGLAGEVATAESAAGEQRAVAITSIGVFDDIINDSIIIDAFQREGSSQQNGLHADRDRAMALLTSLGGGLTFANSKEALDGLRSVREGVTVVLRLMENLFVDLVTLPPTASFDRSERESRKSDVATEKSNLQTALAAIDSALQSLQDAAAAYETRIAAEESTIATAKGNILTLESSIRTGEAQLQLKRAGTRPTSIQASEARVRQARAEYERTRSAFADTILLAPVAGSVTQVNIKAGELLSTSFQQDAAVTMLGESPYRVELFASEVDIPKVETGLEASIELDAFPNQPFPLAVAEVDPAATNVDGVPKYRVKLDFTSTASGFKIGMTGDVSIVTGKRENVLLVPARAVFENDTGQKIVRILVNGQPVEKPIETGLEGENDVEVVSGLTEGETVIVLLKNGG